MLIRQVTSFGAKMFLFVHSLYFVFNCEIHEFIYKRRIKYLLPCPYFKMIKYQMISMLKEQQTSN
jgi:hypothetical protein